MRGKALLALWLAGAAEVNAQSSQALKWYKGNTHTHTLNSDGDTAPDEVARWYREHGYHFLVLTDHNFLTSVDGLNALMGADEQFVILPGEEVTDRFGDKPLHINGLLVERLVPPQGGQSVSEVIQRDVDAIRAANGVPHLNHPNFGWAVTAEDIKKVRNDKLFEIFNGHPLVNNDGGGDRPGLEEMWDDILSSGKRLYGIAVDDAHTFTACVDIDHAMLTRAEANLKRCWFTGLYETLASDFSRLAAMLGLATVPAANVRPPCQRQESDDQSSTWHAIAQHNMMDLCLYSAVQLKREMAIRQFRT